MKASRLPILKILLIIIVCLLSLACVPTEAGPYLSQDTIDRFVRSLPAPPADDSDEHRAELDLVLAAQRTAIPLVTQRMESEFLLTPTVFQSVIAPDFDEEHYPVTFRFLSKVINEAEVLKENQKHRFNRLRPFAVDFRIKALDHNNMDQLSYPSGHTFRGTLYGLILAKLFPNRAEAITRRAQEVGWDRVVAGMHHPSDVSAGRFLANMVFEEMSRSLTFQRDLQRAKEENF